METVPVRLLCPLGRNDKNLVVSDLKASEKTWLVNEVKHFGVSYQDLNNAYGFKPSYMKGLVRKFKKNGVLYDRSGKQDILGSPELRKVKNLVSAGIHNMNTVEFGKILQDEVEFKVSNRTGIAKCSIRPVSRRTIGRKIKQMDQKLGYAEQTTDARAIATANKFNAVSVAVAHYLMMPLINPHIAINADGTSYQTGGALTDKI
jgi:hypothetical protein